MENRSVILAIVAPSGAGKSTLINYLLDNYPDIFQRYPTVTSRTIRPGETQGNPYIFVTQEKIEQMLLDGDFLEFERKPYNNCVYGKTKSVLSTLDPKKILLTEEQIVQVKDLKENLPNYGVYSIYIHIPDLEVMKQRLIARGDDPESIEIRIKTAYEEEVESRHLADFIIPSVQGHVEKSADMVLDILKNTIGVKI
ncbi:MAG: hypothetical protein WCJ19_05355 [bacterium]